MANFRDLLTATKQQIREVDTETADRLRREGSLILDVREADEYEAGAVPGALFIPRGHLESQIEMKLARTEVGRDRWRKGDRGAAGISGPTLGSHVR